MFTQCPEKTKLTEAYHAATMKFGDAVSVLYFNMGTSSKLEYERLRRESDEARLTSDRAWQAMKSHVSVHGC